MTARMFGKLPFTPDHRDLKLVHYIDRATLIDVAMAPMGADWSAFPTVTGAQPTPDTDVLYNDTAGCCVDSAIGHHIAMVGQQTGNSALVVTSGMVKAKYIAQTGFDPTTGKNDTGLVIRDVLKDAMRDGIFGAKPVAFAAVDWTNEDEVALANWIGCGTIGGYQLPSNIWDQETSPGKFTWIVPAGGLPAFAGGHAIFQHGQRTGNSWGCSYVASQKWINSCCDELWLVLWSEWKMANGRAPDGFDFAQLLSDVEARQSG